MLCSTVESTECIIVSSTEYSPVCEVLSVALYAALTIALCEILIVELNAVFTVAMYAVPSLSM